MDNGMTCPKCHADCNVGHTSLDGWDDNLYSGFVFVDFTCPNCNTEFTNVYRFANQETTYEEEA